MLGEDEHLKNIEAGHNLIVKLLKVRPTGYRAPAYFISPKGLYKLVELGYNYDSSAFNSKLSLKFFHLCAIFNKTIRPKKNAKLHSRFPGHGPYLVQFEDKNTLIEWPIPRAIGLGYYGTFHCVACEERFLIPHPISLVSIKYSTALIFQSIFFLTQITGIVLSASITWKLIFCLMLSRYI